MSHGTRRRGLQGIDMSLRYRLGLPRHQRFSLIEAARVANAFSTKLCGLLRHRRRGQVPSPLSKKQVGPDSSKRSLKSFDQQLSSKLWVAGSNPAGVTNKINRLEASRGSILTSGLLHRDQIDRVADRIDCPKIDQVNFSGQPIQRHPPP